jgi:hypothetical protein
MARSMDLVFWRRKEGKEKSMGQLMDENPLVMVVIYSIYELDVCTTQFQTSPKTMPSFCRNPKSIAFTNITS